MHELQAPGRALVRVQFRFQPEADCGGDRDGGGGRHEMTCLQDGQARTR